LVIFFNFLKISYFFFEQASVDYSTQSTSNDTNDIQIKVKFY